MPAKIQLAVTQPCHQNWQHMNATEQGRYCNACAKEVVDFTTMNDTDVLFYFINQKNKNVCGRFYSDQLNREITKPVYPQKKKYWYWNYIAMLFMFLFKSNAGKAQGAVQQHSVEQVSKNDDNSKGRIMGDTIIQTRKFEVTGTITGKNGEPVAGATVIIKGTKNATVTDAKGVYRLQRVSSNDILVVSAVGFKQTEKIAIVAVKNDFNIAMEEVVMGGVVGGVTISNYDYAPPANPNHVAVIEVRDNASTVPVKATFKIKKDNADKIEMAVTDKNGVYKLRRIKETDSYAVTISATGYKDTVLKIKGWNFNERKETKYVFLEKESIPLVAEEQQVVRMGMVSSTPVQPLYVVDGIVVETIGNLKPEEIESIGILKDGSVPGIVSCRPTHGVVIITTKKKKTAATSLKQPAPVTTAGSLQITPNPVQKNNSFQVSFTAKQEGNYVMQIVNDAGVVLQSQKINAKAENNTLQVKPNASWPAGIYYVRIADAVNTVINTGSFVIQ